MESSFTLFRVRGIPIGANWSWLLVFAYLVWSLSSVFPRTYPDHAGSTYLLMAVVATVLFVASLILHELGHALRALREGMEIEGITLWLFGGVAKFKGMFPTAGAEFRIAIAGPAVTAVLIAIFATVTWVLNSTGGPAAVVGVTDYLARINVVLLVFNLVPALPLDGGRVLRSYLWSHQGDFSAATVSAARAGRIFGIVLIGLGALGLFAQAGLGSFLMMLIGFFLIQAAQAEVTFARLRQTTGALRVRDVMTPRPDVVDPSRSVASFVDVIAFTHGHSTFPVVDNGRLVGLVSLRNAGSIPAERRPTTPISDVMVPVADVATLSPDAEIIEALAALQRGPGRAVVVEGDRVVGIVSPSDVARAVQIEELRAAPAQLDPRPAPRLVWVVVTSLIVLVALLLAGSLYSPPVVVITPGQAIDVSSDIRIRGVPVEGIHGKYLLTSVAVEQPTGVGLAIALLRSRQLVAMSDLVPRGVEPERYFDQQRTLFTESQEVAAAAAAKAAGLKVNIDGTGARVVGIVPRSPAADVLEEDDVIVGFAGKKMELSNDVAAMIRSKPSGTKFDVEIERDGRKKTVEVRSREGIAEGAPGIGVLLETRDLDVDLPFKIEFRDRDIGGPSAGVAYALAIYDLLVDDNVAEGRIVATTGTIDLDGRIGAVGGVREKAVAAEEERADLFLVPSDELEDARGSGLDVRGIETLSDALEILAARS